MQCLVCDELQCLVCSTASWALVAALLGVQESSVSKYVRTLCCHVIHATTLSLELHT